MKPLPRVSVSLWSFLIFSALLTICRAECVNIECNSTETAALTMTTTTAAFGSGPNCSFSIGNVTSGNGSITGFIPGTVYEIFFKCLNCCQKAATKPEAVTNLSVTEITTSFMALTWTEPEGNSSFYRVRWTDGNLSKSSDVSQTQMIITGLTAGVQYNVTVTAVAGDGLTEGQSTMVTQYTKPEAVRSLSVTEITTSFLVVNWTEPEGKSSFYRVQWIDGNLIDLTQTQINITGLTAGVQYEVTVTAVAGDGLTKGQSTTVTQYTRPGKVGKHNVETNTSYIYLNWTSPPGQVLKYRVEWNSGKALYSTYTNDSFVVLSDLIPGTTYTIRIISVTGDDVTGQPYIVTSVTKPAVVRNLAVTDVTTSTVALQWTEPVGNTSSYIVQWTVDGVSFSTITNETSFTFKHLIPGSPYNITVTAVAVDTSNIGERAIITTFTRPEKPGNITVTARDADSLNINWTLPEGRVEHYMVNISNTDLKYFSSNETTFSTVHFTGLYPGRIYVVTVTAVAGNFREASEQYLFATNPTPPGSIIITLRTNSSLHLTWATPTLMDGVPDIRYQLTYQSDGGEMLTLSTAVNNTELTELSSGTLYNITLETVGPQNLTSLAVHNSAFTQPNPVLNLVAIPKSTTSVEVTWSYPQGVQSYYKYFVQTYNAMGAQFNMTVSTNHTLIPNLEPGTRYNIYVKTIAATGSESTVEQTYNYTIPNAVTNLRVESMNTTAIKLKWHNPNVSYTYLVIARHNTMVVQNGSTVEETYTFFHLTPGALYTFDVFTVVEGVTSAVNNISDYTIPNPPGSIVVESQSVHSINFTWPFPEGMDHQQYNFSVTSFNGSSLTKTNWFVLDNLESGSLYNISVVTVGVVGYKSTAVTAENYTRPYPVTMLKQADITTNTVTLVWVQQESKPHYSYMVQASNGSIFLSYIVLNTTTTITGLVAGSYYNVTVTTQTADGTHAAPVTVPFITQPETVQPSISNNGSNSSLLVSWTAPPGNVEHYSVHLNSTFPQEDQERLIDNTTNNYLFENLSAGRLYSARVTTCSGSKNASSGFVYNATFPNPPGPFDVLAKTTSSINIKWREAALMTGTSFEYRLSITSPEKRVLLPSNQTSHTFTSLLSGTPYNISITTVGTLNFESEEVQIHMVTTRPCSVKNLSASIQEESIAVTWVEPDEHKQSYSYNVSWQDNSGKTDETMYNITNLVPGSQYNLSVTTETFDRTRGDSKWISPCTDASPVRNLQCKGPNETNAEIIVYWTSPRGQHKGFRVTVNDKEIVNFTNHCCSHTVSNLHHYTLYNLTVETLSCGQPSISVSHQCRTGITNPPVLNESLVIVSQKTHKKFSIRIDLSLLDNAKGPIKEIGVLVTSDLPGNASNWRTYLGNTYNQWKAKDTPVYLATVQPIILQPRSAESHLDIEVGDESMWEGYTNGVLAPGGRYHYAVVAFTSLSLQNRLVNGETSLVSITDFRSIELAGDPAVTGIAIGATLGIFFILFIILIGFIIYWRRLSSKEQTDIQIHSMRAKVSVAVSMEDYEVYYKKQKADSNCGFAEEFEDLKLVGTGQSKSAALTLDNKPKNRYNNVLPYDSSRVKLSIIHGSPYDDYINANYVPGYNSRKEFIAAQGPLPATVKDFWRMIWEKNVQTLVMLTGCNEQGRVKCEQYWQTGTKHFENITVTTTSEIPLEDWTIRDFDIKNLRTTETRSVRQFHFTAWPDHGVPETTELLISFRHLVREHMDQFSRHSPTVVHCSAGVGRTGTFISIDRLIFQIERENIVDVYGIVHDLRMHRPLMVQTEDQYVFLNQCAMDIIRSRTGTNVDLIYQNTAALSIYENVEPQKGYYKYHNT